MATSEFSCTGHGGELAAYRWEPTDPATARYAVLLAHGYGEHMGRYEEFAARLVADGAVVYGVDHVGHGRSAGERVLIEDLDRVVDDLRVVHEKARAEHPDLPFVLVGHSLGGTIATRYAQRFGRDLRALVLSAPAIGQWAALEALLAPDEVPDVPIDTATLSRDPAVGAAYAADPLVWHGPFKRPTLLAMREMLGRIDNGPAFDDLPVIWLHGSDDGLVPREGSAVGWARIAGPGDEEVTYPGARHEIFNETNRRDVYADVIGFVHRALRRSSGDAGRRGPR